MIHRTNSWLTRFKKPLSLLFRKSHVYRHIGLQLIKLNFYLLFKNAMMQSTPKLTVQIVETLIVLILLVTISKKQFIVSKANGFQTYVKR